MSDFSQLSVAQLKQQLSNRNARTTGRKAELLQRLVDYDRNQNFGNPVVDTQTPSTDIQWPSMGFRQVTLAIMDELPDVLSEHIEGYFILRLGLDYTSIGDSQALKKGQLLVKSNKILAVSFLQDGDKKYISAICSAAMKKGVQYAVKVSFDKYSQVCNSSCECPSGIGPHGTCKHLAATLFTIRQIKETRSMGKVNEGCTDRLQSFHKPAKQYSGSPKKCEALKDQSKVFDPRRLTVAHHHRDRSQELHSLMVNFLNEHPMDLNLRYMFPKANLQAAAADHDYLEKPVTQQWILNSIQVTEQGAMAIQESTVDQSGSAAWFDERRWRLTASRFGEITKITERRNIHKLCSSLLSTEQLHSSALSHGKQHEPVAIKAFEEASGKKVMRCGLFILPQYPYLGASPDGIIDHYSIVEVKCPYRGREERIVPGESFPFLENSTNGVLCLKPTHNYYAQVQGQLYLSKRTKCQFIVYTFVDLAIITVNLDKDYVVHSLIPKLELFYFSHYLPFVASQM